MKLGRNKAFELRKSLRLPAPLPVQFRLFDISTREPSPITIYGRTRNISNEGLCLETNTALIGSCNIFLSSIQGAKLLQLEVKFTNTSLPLSLLGRVLWYNSHPLGSIYQFSVGLHFTETTEHSRNLWQKYVKEYKKKRFKAWSNIFPGNK